MRKAAFRIENKDTDHLCSNRATDQRLCFRYFAHTLLPNPNFLASSHLLLLDAVCIGNPDNMSFRDAAHIL